MLTPSRTTGVAPLAVFFDSEGTVATAAPRPFHELSYCWDFGDPESGGFGLTDGASKDRALGPMAGHVFERPGTYTVTLVARDAQQRQAVATVEIEVNDPEVVFAGANTACFSVSGDFTGCPTGAETHTISSHSQIAPHVAPGRRLLYRRGETYPAGGAVRLNTAGPGIVGAFGAGARPRIEAAVPTSSWTAMFTISQGPASNAAFADWRVMDLDVTGMGEANSRAIYIEARGDDLLVLRVRGVDAGGLLQSGGGTYLPGQSNGPLDVLAVQDCELRRVVGGGNVAFLVGRRVALLGNVLHDSTQGEHILRSPWITKGVISHNELGQEDNGRHSIKLHAPEHVTAEPRYTEQVAISDNVFPGTTEAGANNWTVAVGPENDSMDERVRDVIVERNYFASRGTALPVIIWGEAVTVRDNIMFRGANGACVGVGRRDSGVPAEETEPSPSAVHLIHNTCYGTGSFALAHVSSGLTDLRAVNNLLVGSANVGSNYAVSAGNVTAADATAAGLASPAPATAADFVPMAGSPALDAGDVAHRSLWDFSGAHRSDATPDAGAREMP